MANAAVKKIGRNDPCPCGSGRKYKHCCFAQDRARGANARAEGEAVRDALQRATQHEQAGRLREAEAAYQQALQLRPDEGWAHYNLGNVLRAQGSLHEAIDSYRRSVALQPDSVEACCNLGSALKAAGRLEEAIAVYRGALALRPDAALVHFNLGNALKEGARPEEAVACYLKALELDPGMLEVYTNLGLTLVENGKAEAGIDWYRKALAIAPGLQEIHTNLGVALAEQGKSDEALASYRTALALKPDDPGPYSNQLFLAARQSLLAPQQYLALARGWDAVALPAQEREAAQRRRFARATPPGGRLRVGYVSGDFRQHAVSYFLERLVASHDRARIELFAYSTADVRDAVTERFEVLAEHWRPVADLSDAVLRDRIEADRIDVLVDLSGHTAKNRLGVFARRAAPVQAHYLGFFASTGLREMDYWIGDEVITPAAADGDFSEKLWRLPRAWVAYRTLAEAPAPEWRPAGDGTVWLGSFNSLSKVNPETLALWARVLLELPQACLRLKNKELGNAGNRQRILDALAGHGIAPDRVDLQGASDWAGYMAQYGGLDIALDPVISHGGGTTTCDALWMGVPVIHALGSRVGSRFTASMLGSVGHPEWIAGSEAEYVEKAVALAKDAGLRKQIRLELRGQMAGSPLCDFDGLAKCLEDAYFEMRLKAASA
jgi:predicted O-linked N-acetylglucosamine transferase (SPINDLY family)